MTFPVFTDTIFALATPPGRGALAVVRLSGPQAIAAVQALCPAGGPAPRMQTLRKLVDPATGEVLDHALVSVFIAPHSFTGEDVAEFSLHGGRAVVSGVMAALSAIQGVRPAEPGEFTKRAFLHHRLDLTEAEAVADLIHAETALQRRQALTQLSGGLSDLYDRWRDALIKSCAYVEAHLDFPDEGLPDDLMDHVRPGLENLARHINAHLSDNRRGERLRDGVQVVIVGAPNAGKSSLLNMLAKRDVAIVSDYAGTTRDVLDVHLDVGGYPVTLTDTAGLRPDQLSMDGAGQIEAEGIRRALDRARLADLKLVVFDGTQLPGLDPHSLALVDAATLVIVNKTDAPGVTCPDQIAGVVPIAVSAQTGTGLDDLLVALSARLQDLVGQAEGISLTRERHRQALQSCAGFIAAALACHEPELVAEELRGAINALGRITGRVDVEDLLDVIFRDFCIGK